MIRIGTAGWSYKDWEGIIYPPNPSKGFHGATYLAKFFDTIEMNLSFYRPPTAAAGRGWVKRVSANPRFKFTAKICRGFTHGRNATQDDERAIKEAFDVFLVAGRLGGVLTQFPWSFKFTTENREYVAQLRQRFRDYPLVLEIRHSNWNDPHALELLADLGIGFCNIDQALRALPITISLASVSTAPDCRVHIFSRVCAFAWAQLSELVRGEPDSERALRLPLLATGVGALGGPHQRRRT